MLATFFTSGLALAEPGDHIRAGDLMVVPQVDLGAEARTNIYRQEADPSSAANLLLAPSLQALAAGDDHEFEFGGVIEFRKYFYLEDADQAVVADPVSRLDQFDEFSLSAGLDNFKRSSIGFRLQDNMANRNWSVDAEADYLPFTTQFGNDLKVGIRGNPGPALEIVPGGIWEYDSYRVPATLQGDERQINERHTYGPRLDARWAFLPRTALVFESSYTFNRWRDNVLLSPESELVTDFAVPDSEFFKALVGLDGRLTAKLFAQVFVGWGFANYDETTLPPEENTPAVAQDFVGPGVLVRTQLRYDITSGDQERPGTQAYIGYVRDFRDSYFTNYVIVDQGFAQLDMRVGDFTPSARYELRSEIYRGEVDRNDLVNRVTLDLAYWLQDYAKLTLGGGWHQRASTDPIVEYDDISVHLLGTFIY
jgi:hypothetical protein